MLDPAMLHLPNGEFVIVDLNDLRRHLSAEARDELNGACASRQCAALLWSQTYDNYEQRAFFLAAVREGSGFAISRINPLHDALDWLQRHRAVVRWYEEDGSATVRISVHDADDDIIAVHHAADGDVPRCLQRAVAELAAELARRTPRRHLCAVPDLPGEPG